MPSFEEQISNLCSTNKIVYSGELHSILLTLNQNILTIRRDIQLRLDTKIAALETHITALETRIAKLETVQPPGKSDVRIGKK